MMLLLVTVGEWSLVPLGSEDISHSYSIADKGIQEDVSKLLSALFFVSFVVASGMLLFNVVAGNFLERWHQEETEKEFRREKDGKPIAWLWIFAYLFLCEFCSTSSHRNFFSPCTSMCAAVTHVCTSMCTHVCTSMCAAVTHVLHSLPLHLDVCRCYPRHILINRLRDEAVLQSVYAAADTIDYPFDSHSESDGSRSNSCMCGILEGRKQKGSERKSKKAEKCERELVEASRSSSVTEALRQAKIPKLLLSEMCRAAKVMAQEESRNEVVEELLCDLSLLNRTERETKLTKLKEFRKKERNAAQRSMEYLHEREMYHLRGMFFGKEEEKEEKEEKKEEEKTEEQKEEEEEKKKEEEEEEENRPITPRTKEKGRRLSIVELLRLRRLGRA
jgi:hypothetical protein